MSSRKPPQRQAHIAILKNGAAVWNSWRAAHPDVRPSLRDVNLDVEFQGPHGLYDLPSFGGVNFSGADLHGVTARNCTFTDCVFDGADINVADLCFACFVRCSFRRVRMRVSKLGSATFTNCVFEQADLSYCSAEGTDFSGTTLAHCRLDHMSLVKSTFRGARIEQSSVYGTSVWDVDLTRCVQRDIMVFPESSLMVDNLELAQFIHLLVRSKRIREAIDTIVSKVVLILGRFTPERKRVLERLRDQLRRKNYVPILFDFAVPNTRDLSETVATIAHLARFVVADLSDAKSVPHELTLIIPNLPSVPVQPIICAQERPFGMFEHFRRYPWVLKVIEYQAGDQAKLLDTAISNCEAALKRGQSSKAPTGAELGRRRKVRQGNAQIRKLTSARKPRRKK